MLQSLSCSGRLLHAVTILLPLAVSLSSLPATAVAHASLTKGVKISSSYRLSALHNLGRNDDASAGADQYDDYYDDQRVLSGNALVGNALDATTNNNVNKNDKSAPPIPDDVYHCADPQVVATEFSNDNTVQCDPNTHLWNLQALDPKHWPRKCDRLKFQFTTVAALVDWQEPCYLWMTLYGELMPSVSPTQTPTRTPTSYPTYQPSLQPTDHPTISPMPTSFTLQPTEAATKKYKADPRPTWSNAGPHVYEIATVVMTYFIDPSTRRRGRLLRATTDIADDSNSERKSRERTDSLINKHRYVMTDYMSAGSHNTKTTRQRRGAAVAFDSTVLEQITARHVKQELKRQLVFWLEQQQQQPHNAAQSTDPETLQVSVDLTMTSVRSFLLPNKTFVATEALSGYVSVNVDSTNNSSNSNNNIAWPTSVDNNIKQAFEGNALNRYIDALRQQTADASLQHTNNIQVGLPLDLLGDARNSGNSSNSGSSLSGSSATAAAKNDHDNSGGEKGWTVWGITFSLTTLAIIAGSVALFSIILLVCVWWRMRLCRVKQQQDATLNAASSDDTANDNSNAKNADGAKEDGSRSRKSKRSQKTQKIRNGKAATQKTNDISPTNSQTTGTEDERFQRFTAVEDDIDNRSLATSTYSYLDSGLYGYGAPGANVSLAPSFLYGNDDASMISKNMWSLIEGVTNDDDNYTYTDTASPSKRLPHIDVEGNLQTPEQMMKSPSNMMISTAPKNPYDTNGYNDEEDDQLSLLSYDVGGGSPRRPIAFSPVDDSPQDSRHLHTKSIADIVSTPTSKETQTFADSGSEEHQIPSAAVSKPAATTGKETDEMKDRARLGVSARKKKTSAQRFGAATSATATNSAVRKALGQLTACGKSERDNCDGHLIGVPLDEVHSGNNSPASDIENRDSSQPPSHRLSTSGPDNQTVLRDVNRMLDMGAASGEDGSGKNNYSNLHPGKLLNDTTLKSEESMDQKNKNNRASVIDTSSLLKDKDGRYMLETMSSF